MTPFLDRFAILDCFTHRTKTDTNCKAKWSICTFYPLVGLLIGLILFGLSILLVKVPIILVATIILVIWIWLTGGLHLDGLADTADAWVGGFGDRERTLKIMKDPSCGPIGVLSLVIVCLMKFSALYVLLEQRLSAFLILIPMLGRSVPLFLFLTTRYVRANGLGRSITDSIPKTLAWMVLSLH